MLERDPETPEKALKVATRLEALGSVDVNDNWDDAGRCKDRFVKVSTANESSELTSLMRDIKSELQHKRKERERPRRSGDGRRSGSELEVGLTDESVRPTRYSYHHSGGYGAGEWQAPPRAPPPFQQHRRLDRTATRLRGCRRLFRLQFRANTDQVTRRLSPMTHVYVMSRLPVERHCTRRRQEGATIDVTTVTRVVTGRPNIRSGSSDRRFKEHPR